PSHETSFPSPQPSSTIPYHLVMFLLLLRKQGLYPSSRNPAWTHQKLTTIVRTTLMIPTNLEGIYWCSAGLSTWSSSVLPLYPVS
ncbi:Uncharacterized protein DAT39_001014, partial [Clarias magur]